MARRSSNQQRSAWTVHLLDIRPDDRVLELGYGPGLGIEAALGRLRTGSIVGVDHSATMRRMAARRARAAGGAVQPDLRIGDAGNLAPDIGTFDKIFSCNVWLFWQDPVGVFERLRDHLAPGGTVAVTHLPRHGGAGRDTSLGAAAAIADLLTRAGYRDIRRQILELDPAPAVCALASPAQSGTG